MADRSFCVFANHVSYFSLKEKKKTNWREKNNSDRKINGKKRKCNPRKLKKDRKKVRLQEVRLFK